MSAYVILTPDAAKMRITEKITTQDKYSHLCRCRLSFMQYRLLNCTDFSDCEILFMSR